MKEVVYKIMKALLFIVCLGFEVAVVAWFVYVCTLIWANPEPTFVGEIVGWPAVIIAAEVVLILPSIVIWGGYFLATQEDRVIEGEKPGARGRRRYG